MARTTTDGFSAALQKILKEYQEDVSKNVDDLAKKFTQKGVKEVKSASGQFGGTGKYANGWTSKFESGRLSSQGIIYNNLAGLPHLLEKGHANRGGGRTAGRVHIAPVEETLVKEFQKAVEQGV